VPNPFAPSLAAWYAQHGRDLPWRHPECSSWGVLVSEVMLQQTPVARVVGPWRQWVERWPTPPDLAATTPADVLRQWGRLGYPRRALRLRQTAITLTIIHAGAVPTTPEELATLPGIGPYTAAAVAAFAFGCRVVVLDTNIRRLLARAVTGQALPPPSPRAAERRLAEALLPETAGDSVIWNQAAMEFGALVCTARSPGCADCPVADDCAWRAHGCPPDPFAGQRRAQTWAGSDRQARGLILAALRAAPDGLLAADALALIADPTQARRALAGLLADGLAARQSDWLTLPSLPHLDGNLKA